MQVVGSDLGPGRADGVEGQGFGRVVGDRVLMASRK